MDKVYVSCFHFGKRIPELFEYCSPNPRIIGSIPACRGEVSLIKPAVESEYLTPCRVGDRYGVRKVRSLIPPYPTT